MDEDFFCAMFSDHEVNTGRQRFGVVDALAGECEDSGFGKVDFSGQKKSLDDEQRRIYENFVHSNYLSKQGILLKKSGCSYLFN